MRHNCQQDATRRSLLPRLEGKNRKITRAPKQDPIWVKHCTHDLEDGTDVSYLLLQEGEPTLDGLEAMDGSNELKWLIIRRVDKRKRRLLRYVEEGSLDLRIEMFNRSLVIKTLDLPVVDIPARVPQPPPISPPPEWELPDAGKECWNSKEYGKISRYFQKPELFNLVRRADAGETSGFLKLWPRLRPAVEQLLMTQEVVGKHAKKLTIAAATGSDERDIAAGCIGVLRETAWIALAARRLISHEWKVKEMEHKRTPVRWAPRKRRSSKAPSRADDEGGARSRPKPGRPEVQKGMDSTVENEAAYSTSPASGARASTPLEATTGPSTSRVTRSSRSSNTSAAAAPTRSKVRAAASSTRSKATAMASEEGSEDEANLASGEEDSSEDDVRGLAYESEDDFVVFKHTRPEGKGKAPDNGGDSGDDHLWVWRYSLETEGWHDHVEAMQELDAIEREQHRHPPSEGSSKLCSGCWL